MRRILFALTLVLALATPALAQQQSGEPLTCAVINSAATTLTAFTGTGCIKREPQLAFYISDVTVGATVISSATTDTMLTLKYGTGTNCGTGTVTLWATYNLANQAVIAAFSEPLKVPGGQDLCWIHAGVGSKTFIVRGHLGPQ